MSNIARKPKVSTGDIDKFISGAPDAAPAQAATAPAPVATRPAEVKKASGRKQPISLTIDSGILAELDDVAASLGVSRAAAFSLAVSRFIAQHKKEA